MADIKKLVPKVIYWESPQYTETPGDLGGPTKYGVTLNEWIQHGYDKNGDGIIDKEDVKLLDQNDFEVILKSQYWDKWKADLIENQSVAELLVDWLYNSGVWAIKLPQRILGLTEDGLVGPKTIEAVNLSDQEDFFNKVWNSRKDFYNQIVARRPEQGKFLKGWMNRLNSYKFVV
jgi:lysozyme family protein